MNPSVVVIGSGLSAVGAIKALLKRGIRPTILDVGEDLDPERSAWIEKISRKEPKDWTPQERAILGRNPTVNDGSSIPRKFVFGSDYFYGSPKSKAPVKADGNIPPYSYALGGLSVGWGAAVLPPQPCDISDWPISADELNNYCRIVLEDLPYSAKDDGLSKNFPILSSTCKALNLGLAGKFLLDAFSKTLVLKKDEVLFGQARLLVSPESTEEYVGCKYCGQCMSGCVYKSIYKSSDEILRMHQQGKIEYISGCLVDTLSEENEIVNVKYFDTEGKSHSRKFDRVFLAAGAANSARVVLNSLGKFNQEVRLKTRGGFVMPVFSFRKLPSNWPECNTQPGLFLELKGNDLEHWVHVQVSTENELLLQKLGVQEGAKGIIAGIKRFVASHMLLIFVNYHSDHAGHYKLWITEPDEPGGTNCLHTSHKKSSPQFKVLWVSCLKLFRVFAKFGCLPLFPFARLNSGAYHVGGTLPMRAKPSGNLETDILGRIEAWKHVHVVDTSVFPSLPGTTVGLLTMANAYRIVDRIDWKVKQGVE